MSLIPPTLFYTSTAAAAKSCQSCPTLCNPIDSSSPGSPILGILQARTLEWVAISSPMHESEKWKWSRSVMPDSSRRHGLQPTRLLHPWDFPGKSTGVGCHCLLQVLPYINMNLHGGTRVPHPEPPSHLPRKQNWKRHVYPSVHRSTIYNSQDMEAT